MFLIRPVEENDLADLCKLAETAKGLTTLPNDKKILRNKILDSLKAFSPHVRKPNGEAYLFVLEDLSTHKIVGTSGVLSKTGGFEPFYTYQIRDEKHESQNPSVCKIVPTLHLVKNHNGPSELYGLFLHPGYRKHGLGKLLSFSRFLFIKNFKNRFDKKIISELRGVIDQNGKSPFWECVGKHFFEIDFYTADFLSGTGNKQFIEDLMPKYPIYISLLPYDVQKVIGEVHEKTKPARKFLEDQGFIFENEVDIFDAGPTVTATTTDIGIIKNSEFAQIADLTTSDAQEKNIYLISNQSLNFRACQGELTIQDDGSVLIAENVAKALQIQKGDPVSFYKLS